MSAASESPSNLEQHRKLAKELLKSARAGDRESLVRLQRHAGDRREFKLADAQHVIAVEAGLESWPKMVKQLEQIELRAAADSLHRGDAKSLRRLLRASPSLRRKVNEPLGPFGQRPIHMAGDNRELIDVLIEAGADVNLRSDWSNGPYTAIDHTDESTTRHLIARGAALTAHAAARLGWFDELRAIVESNPRVVHEPGGDGQRPLHFAKTVQITDYLLDRGAEIDARCVDHHSTAAQYALVNRPDVCRHLLDRGATSDIFMAAQLGDRELIERLIGDDPKCVAARINWPGYAPVPPFNIYCWDLGWNRSPYDVAAGAGHRDVAQVIASHRSPADRLIDAAWMEDEAETRSTFRDHPDVMATLQPAHHAMLAHAAHHQRDTAFRLMVELNFDASQGANDGGSALHQAAWVGRADYVERLLPNWESLLALRDPTHNSTPLGWAEHGAMHRCNPRGDYARSIELLKGD